MRYIERLSKPSFLEKKEEEWLAKFLEKGEKRPDSSKYGHSDIRDTLCKMSHHKCFYCEQMVKNDTTEKRKEVEHFIEVAHPDGKNLAFTWENLYLTCHTCNGKKAPHQDISVHAVLDPCKDLDEEIAKHLTFEDEVICYLTEKGEQTIKKYGLDREPLESARVRLVKDFYKRLCEYEQAKEEDKAALLRVLQSFKEPQKPFSMMFRVLLAKRGW